MESYEELIFYLVDSNDNRCYIQILVKIKIRKRVIEVSEVEVRKDESFEAALRRFKKKIEQEGILREVRDRKHYEKPSERRRKKLRRS